MYSTLDEQNCVTKLENILVASNTVKEILRSSADFNADIYPGALVDDRGGDYDGAIGEKSAQHIGLERWCMNSKKTVVKKRNSN